MSYKPLTVTEGDDPLYSVTAEKRLPDGTIVPVDLTGSAVKWTVKLAPDVDDQDAIATYDATITDAVNGKYSVQVTNTATAVPGAFWYNVKQVAGGKQFTLQYGDWFVENT